MMKNFITLLFVSCIIFLNAQDVNTGATPCYYDSLSIEEMMEVIKTSDEAHSMATVNEDGTPNAAYMQPNIVDNENILFYLASDCLTRKNVDRTGYAMFSFYIQIPEGKTWKDKYKGGRFLLKKITDEEKIKELSKKVELSEKYKNDAIFFEIVKLIPFS